VAAGHDFHQLLDGYPASVVKGLLLALRRRDRLRMVERALGLTAAVTGALDLALNQGKGKVLEQWVKEMLAEEKDKAQAKRSRMSDRAFAFFTSLPRKA
jgi:L-alanine-DL-glutamate epimerase-like enolase superfamily enzyme